MKINNDDFNKKLSGSLSLDKVKNNSDFNFIFEALDTDSDGNINLKEITLFANEMLKHDENNDGEIGDEELEKALKDYGSAIIEGKKIRKFLKYFLKNSDKSEDNNIRTEHENGSYTITVKQDGATQNTTFDKDNNLLFTEDITDKKTTVTNKDGKLLKTIETRNNIKITTNYDDNENITSKLCEKDGIIITEKEYKTNGTRQQIDTYNYKNGQKPQYPSTSVITENGKIVQEIEYDENGFLTGITDYEAGRIKKKITRGKDEKLQETQFMGDTKYFQPPSQYMDKKIDITYQGNVGDCWLLSGLNSLNNTPWGRKAIENCIQIDEKTGNITIKLPGAYGRKKEFIITQKELEAARDNEEYSTGDNDVLAFEIAIDKYRKQYGEKIDDGGFQEEIYRLILGNTNTSWLYDKTSINNLLLKFEKNPTNYLIAPCFNLDGTVHAYTLKRIETDPDGKKYVIFTNPWNSKLEIRMEKTKFIQELDNIEYSTKPKELPAETVPEIQSDQQIGATKMSRKSNKSVAFAVINAFMTTQTGREKIKEIIKPDNKGNLIVTIKGISFTISKEDIATAKASGYYSEGDDDLIAFEIAVERFHCRKLGLKYDDDELSELTVGLENIKYVSEILELLGEQDMKYYPDPKIELSKIEEVCKNPDKYAIIGSGSYGNNESCTVKRIQKNEFGEYIFTITRPEDSSIEIQYTYEEFIKMYPLIQFIEF